MKKFLAIVWGALLLTSQVQSQDILSFPGTGSASFPCMMPFGAQIDHWMVGSGSDTTFADTTMQVMELCPQNPNALVNLTLDQWALCSNLPDGGQYLVVYNGPSSDLSVLSTINPLWALDSLTIGTYSQNVVFNSLITGPAGSNYFSEAINPGCMTFILIEFGTCPPGDGGFIASVGCVEEGPFCDISAIDPIVNECQGATSTYSIEVDASLILSDNPGTSVQVFVDGNPAQIIDMVAGNNNFTISGLNADGAGHILSFEIIAYPGCTFEIGFTAPAACTNCTAQAGTAITGGTDVVICGQQNNIWNVTGQVVSPLDVNDPNTSYNPGLAWAIFSTMPNITTGDVTSDPSYVGIYPGSAGALDGTYPLLLVSNNGTANQINALFGLPNGFNAPLEFYVAPITMYNYQAGVISVPGTEGPCADLGEIAHVILNPPTTVSSPTIDCVNGTVTFTPTQGNAALNVMTYNILNVQPATATAPATVNNGSPFTISNLVDGDTYSFQLVDPNGCTVSPAAAQFQGAGDPTIPGVPDICQNSDAVQLVATPSGGIWSGTGISAGGIFNPDNTPGPGTYAVSYTTLGICGGTATANVIVMTNDNCITGTVSPIGTPSVIACGGFLTDDGLQASDYSPNFNDTTVVCPDPAIPLDQISALSFNVFDLGFGDQLSIFNGNSVSAPLIGIFQGTDIVTQSFFSTDPSGCLTVVFISDADASVGNFSAEITCGIPCQNPELNITVDQPDFQPTKICQGETVTFNASATQFFNGGQYVSHEWQFGDGTIDTTSWPIVAHQFDDAGGYIVQLLVTDNNGCTNSVLPDILIFTSTTPNIDLSTSETDNTICTGVTLDVEAVFDPVTWTNVPEPNLGGSIFIPDDQSQCFSDTLNFTGFDGGLTITSTADIEDIFVNMEHSFMGDFVITLYCPDGSAIVLHQQGGSGTLLGEPVDIDTDLSPGVGYDYYWTPTATNGTWSENSGGTLDAGEYEPVQPFTNLIGCPMNGDWIIEICDLWASDNGYIFDWNIHFADYMYPDWTTFTPNIGIGCDSSYWTAPSGSIITDPFGLCDTLAVTQAGTGSYVYTYHVMDDHGCEYTEDITVNFYAAPVAEAGPTVNYCGTPVQIPNVASNNPLSNPTAGITYTYAWASDSLDYLSSPGTMAPSVNGLPVLVGESYQVQYNVVITSNQDPACTTTDSVLVNIPPYLVPSTILMDTVYCLGDQIDLLYPYWQYSNSYSYNWNYSPEAGVVIDSLSLTYLYTVPSVFSTAYILDVVDEACNYSAFYTYLITEDPCTVAAPNIFTPDNDDDDQNNVFEITGLYYPNTDILKFPGSVLKVYNRWGSLVYENENYDNSWNGEGLAEGTYYYIFLQNLENQKDRFLKGDVYITR